MEKLAEQPTPEKLKSFDPLASVDMFRYDLKTFGQVLPETYERIVDEELSFLVEGMNRAARTSFTLQRQEGELVYFDRGIWKPYTGTLITGLHVAKEEAEQDSRRAFLVDRATDDLAHGYKLNSLKAGEKHAWYSPYAHEEEARFGKQFVNSCGLVADRQMGFLYLAECQSDGSVLLESQTVDTSDEEAFTEAIAVIKEYSTADLDDMTLAYDTVLAKKHGDNFFAGRLGGTTHENAWHDIQRERDLVEFHLQGLEEIAAMDLPREALEHTAKKHVYGIWAAFRKRLDGTTSHRNQVANPTAYSSTSTSRPVSVSQEVQYAYQDFAARGELLIACGGTIGADSEETIMEASPANVFSIIFGTGSKLKSLEERVGKITRGRCQVATCPTRPNEVKVGGCGVCLDRCQKLFDAGKDPTKLGTITRAAGESTVKGTVRYVTPPKETPSTRALKFKQGEHAGFSSTHTQNAKPTDSNTASSQRHAALV